MAPTRSLCLVSGVMFVTNESLDQTCGRS